MLRVFVSSTFRDLKKERKVLLDKLETVLLGVGMEKFIPDGQTSQEIGVKELRDSDLVIFLISPYYGSIIKKCKIKDCKAECPMKSGEGEISYTHCEYKVALAENKPHQAYLVDEDWDVIEKLKDWRSLDWREVWENPVFKGLERKKIEHYFRVAKKVWEFEEEARLEFCPQIKDVKAITDHLAQNIVKWYSKGMINLDDFCGRRKELTDLSEKIGESVEVFGVGGIGKTTLIHVALLIQKLKGKKPVTVGTKQSYLTGSGYRYFREKCEEDQHEIIGNTITLDDITDALSLLDEVGVKAKKEKLSIISDRIEERNIILFIDDFHLADRDVRELIKNAKGAVTASRRRVGIARNELPLLGIERRDREDLIKLVTKRLKKEISDDAKEKIKDMTEGHPVSTEILVRNYEKINFQELEDFKYGLDFSNPEHVEEFLKRVVKEALSEEAASLSEALSVINTDLENNLDKTTIEQTYAICNLDEVFTELVDAGMLEKKEGKEGIYQFSYSHIKEALKEEGKTENHERAIEYYKNKTENFGKSYEDVIEVLFHRSKSNPDENLVDEFLIISDEIGPRYPGFKRLIDVGEELRNCLKNEHKAPICGALGNLYRNIARFEESEKAHKEALVIYKKLAKKNPKTYLPYVAVVQNNLGILLSNLRRFEESEKAHKEALVIYKKLAKKNPKTYLLKVALSQNNLAALYGESARHEKVEKPLKEALVIYKKLAKKNPKTYLSYVAMVQNNLGNLYSILDRFEKSEKAYDEALVIYMKLAKKDQEALLHEILQTQANIGTLYIETNRHEEGINTLKSVLKQRDLLPDFGARCLGWLGTAYEKLQNPKDAAQNHLFSSAIYFVLFRKGVFCLDFVLRHLVKVIELGDEEVKGDAELMLTAIYRLAGQEVDIPQGSFSKRGEALKEALNGRKVEFKPENEIDLMVLALIKDTLSQK